MSDQTKIKFGSDGIRGIEDKWPFDKPGINQIVDSLAIFISRNFIDPYVLIGRDTRLSGRWISEIFTRKLSNFGICVVDLGVIPTPALAYLTKKEKADLGVIISASHNPSQYNGLKIVNSSGLRLQKEGEVELETLFNQIHESVPDVSGKKIVQQKPQISTYIQDHIECLGVNRLKGLSFVIDCANGSSSMTANQVLSGIGAKVLVVNNDITGENIINEKCGSEYARENQDDFAKIVRQMGMNYGLAFDGDGDRLFMVDKAGNSFNGDDMLFVLANWFKHKGELRENVVVITNMANTGLIESLHKSGITAQITKNGDKYLEAMMQQHNYLLGTEQVGNLMINDESHGFADPLFAAGLIFGIANEQKKTLRDMTENLKKYPQILLSVNLSDKINSTHLDEIGKKCFGDISVKMQFWYSSTEDGIFNVMIEGRENITIALLLSTAHSFVNMLDSDVIWVRETILSCPSISDQTKFA